MKTAVAEVRQVVVPSMADAIRADLAAGDAGYRAAGEKFIAQKAALTHGEWLPWLKRERFSVRTAQRLMEYAKCDAGVVFAEINHPEPDVPAEPEPQAAVPGQTVTISASKFGRGPVTYTASWTEHGGESYQSGYRTLEEAMEFCPCSMASMDPGTIDRVVIPGVTVQHSIPRGMGGHNGYYQEIDGKKVAGSEVLPDLYELEDDESEPAEADFTRVEASATALALRPTVTCTACGETYVDFDEHVETCYLNTAEDEPEDEPEEEGKQEAIDSRAHRRMQNFINAALKLELTVFDASDPLVGLSEKGRIIAREQLVDIRKLCKDILDRTK